MVRLTWQVVALVLGILAAAVAAAKVAFDHDAARGQIAYTIYAIDRGGKLDGDQIVMPGDAEDGTYPDREA